MLAGAPVSHGSELASLPLHLGLIDGAAMTTRSCGNCKQFGWLSGNEAVSPPNVLISAGCALTSWVEGGGGSGRPQTGTSVTLVVVGFFCFTPELFADNSN